MGKLRIGIMGGTMNPIHEGHVHMAKAAMAAASLDHVLMMPAGNPPHKADVPAAEDRYRMVAAAVAGHKNLIPSRVEVEREGATYTVDTLNILRGRYPKDHFYYIIGEDTLMDLRHWRHFEQVLRMCTFLVMPRNGRGTPAEIKEEKRWLRALDGRFVNLDAEKMNVSSTEIRAQLQAGAPTPHLAYPVRAYALLTGLYGDPLLPDAKGWMEKLFQLVTPKRFAHSLSVALMAGALAEIHGVSLTQAYTAGLLHDCAKCMTLPDLQGAVRAHHIPVDEDMMESTLLHGPVGADIARHQFGVGDEAVLDAIRRHTVGAPEMTDLDMVVYLADKIEPTRTAYPLLEKVRKAAQKDLKQAMIISMEGAIAFLKKGGKSPHPATGATVAWLEQYTAHQQLRLQESQESQL